jgi:hypothetical protein
VEAGNIGSVSSTIKRLIDNIAPTGHHIAIDVTSGTKDLVLGSLMNDLAGQSGPYLLSAHRLAEERRPAIHPDTRREDNTLIDVLAEVR